MSNKYNKKIIIATGGTGGHIFPAYSLAKHFLEKDINVEIISDKRGLRYLRDIEDVKIIKIGSSTIFQKNILKSLSSIFLILFSFFKSIFYLVFNRPNLIFGMGGYSSFTVCIASKILNIPFIIYENNLHIGKTNKYLLPFAKKILVSNKELSGVPKKYNGKVIQIGNIIRKEIINHSKNVNLDAIDKKLSILILGGSQAAKVFAEVLPYIFQECKNSGISFKLYQQCLPEQNDFLNKFYNKINIQFEIFNYSKNILDYFSKANLAITRSGSSMLAELINVKIPFISVPLPSAADNHQYKNAIFYEKKQFCYLIEEKDLKNNLFKLIKKINNDKSLLKNMILKQQQFSDKLVYERIDEQLVGLI